MTNTGAQIVIEGLIGAGQQTANVSGTHRAASPGCLGRTRNLT